MNPNDATRRDFLQQATRVGAAGAILGMPGIARTNEAPSTLLSGSAEQCIMLWLSGGVGQIDTFDPKRKSKDGLRDPGSAYESIPTAIRDVSLCEHLPKTAQLLDRTAIVRTLHHNEVDDHAAASYRLHVGRPISDTIVYPSIGSVISYCKESLNEAVPSYVLVGHPTVARGSGFLGPNHGFVYLTDHRSGPKGLVRPERISDERHRRRQTLLESTAKSYVQGHNDDDIAEYMEISQRGFQLAGPEFLDIFDLEREPAALRESYGEDFGQRCLLARRLIEAGSRYVEISFNMGFVNGTGWDVHYDGLKKQHLLIDMFDRAFSALLVDLEKKKMLDRTLIIVGTEFGRPAQFDSGGGRGHHPKAFSAMLAGGGLRTGQVIGQTDELAMKPLGRRVSIPDWLATIYAALGIDYTQELYAGNRPVPLTDRGQAIQELFV